jgi:endonuclease YncB( thermonuclease family)
MVSNWYVTFAMRKTVKQYGRRLCRATNTFETEAEAKNFARMKLDEGLIVNAGTINPHSPKQAIASSKIHLWLEDALEKLQ